MAECPQIVLDFIGRYTGHLPLGIVLDLHGTFSVVLKVMTKNVRQNIGSQIGPLQSKILRTPLCVDDSIARNTTY